MAKQSHDIGVQKRRIVAARQLPHLTGADRRLKKRINRLFGKYPHGDIPREERLPGEDIIRAKNLHWLIPGGQGR